MCMSACRRHEKVPLCFGDGALWAVMEGPRSLTGDPYAVIITLDCSG